MLVTYVRQLSENSPLEYLESAREFAYSHLANQYYKNIVYLTEPDESEKALYVRSVGYEISDPQKSIINRSYPAGSIIHYIVGGEGTFNGKPIRKGDCAVAFHDRPHSICTNPNNPLEFYWMIIRHTADFDLEAYGFDRDNDVFLCPFEEAVEKIFDHLLYVKLDKQDAHCYYLSKMYELLSWHRFDYIYVKRTKIPDKDFRRVALAKRMWEQADYQLSVSEIAKKLGLSRKHFSSIFLAETKMHPSQYVLDRKIRLAQNSIDSGDTNYKMMAIRLGYKDYPSFYRAFKKIMGEGPSEYASHGQVKNKTNR